MPKIITILIFVSCLLLTCSTSVRNTHQYKNGGVVISFDDKSIDAWCFADSCLSQYNWKASFAVTHVDRLTDREYDKLRYLQNNGHEIAGHGLKHINAKKYVDDFGVENYINFEILPMLKIFEQQNIDVSSFVYPYGERTKKIDNELYAYFNILRGTDYKNSEPLNAMYFFNNDRLVFGYGIDEYYDHFNMKKIFELLQFARDNDQILILYSHVPKPEVHNPMEISINTLDIICNYVQKNNMEFYRFSDLYDLID